MPRRKLKRPSPGTVLGLLALIVASAGNTGAFAGTTHVIVRKGDIAKGAVTAKALAKSAVHAKALSKGAVTARALKQGAVGPEAIAADAVGAAAIRKGAVTAEAIGANAVGARALAEGAVSANKLAANAVTSSALAPGSVYGGALGPVALHAAPIGDLDTIPHNGEWTASNTETAACGVGEHLLTGGIVFTNPGNREVGVLEALPFSNSNLAGIVGRITSDSGGIATAEVQAICLK